MISLDDSMENWESLLAVQRSIIVAFEDASHFDFLTGSTDIDKIVQENDILLPWNTASRHRTRALLYRDTLVVAIQSQLDIQSEWTIALALWAASRVDLFVSILIEWSHQKSAFRTVKLNHLELREDWGAARDHARYFHKGS